jgi:hypothetical protein
VKGKVQHFSWITDLRVNKGTVYRIMQGARARWRIENETFNTLVRRDSENRIPPQEAGNRRNVPEVSRLT